MSAMGYFDGLTSGSFKTAQDGRRLFFPWGVLGGGYAIASEQDYLRLRQQVKAYMVVTLVLVIVSGMYDPYLAPLAAAALLVAFYLAWMWRVLPRLKRSDEKLSLQESMTSQAQAHGAVVLWVLEIGSIAFVIAGIAMLVFDSGSRLTALACTAFFGLCAAKITRLLVLRHRMAATRL
jgi:Gpi18-like mannosyltransferase